MPGPSPGDSPEREVGAGRGQRGPGRGRRVRFRLPPTAIALPSVHEEEQVFYRRLEALATPGPGGFGPLFAADGWSDLTEDRLLRKRVVRDGQDGLRPRPGQEVSVKVLGALEDGALVERDPRLTFVPGYGDVVQDRGEQGLGTGSRCCTRREPDVPPEAPLLFEVTLLEVRDGLEQQPLPPAARLRLGAQRRERGNFHFTRGDFPAALRSYRLALSALDGPAAAPPGPHEEEELREQRVKCFNNCAAAELKLQRVEEALAACEAALSISPDNGRALLRRGQLLAQQGRDAEAALVLRRALELDPANEVCPGGERCSGPSGTGGGPSAASAAAAALPPAGGPRGAVAAGEAPERPGPRRPTGATPRPDAAELRVRGRAVGPGCPREGRGRSPLDAMALTAPAPQGPGPALGGRSGLSRARPEERPHRERRGGGEPETAEGAERTAPAPRPTRPRPLRCATNGRVPSGTAHWRVGAAPAPALRLPPFSPPTAAWQP
ncbi:peptidyl-prolyl cis-trans isomerase FKBP8-like [Melopsittacus undulatus]|uniref:peptidyl-prolyl cis-trans isomerase FKBP8-like n=1 Tax=Melopsittacus undulatus TaxID=13146 RepID=UPI00146CE73F|nr:peptidyl-prolyl cis-trans isomerase FKBP8-like [Melopsittacus undulatus]